jgi:hypothetical protein
MIKKRTRIMNTSATVLLLIDRQVVVLD